MLDSTATLEQVREYYGKVVQSRHDLKTNSCCTGDALPPHLRAALSRVASEIQEKFYGCGSPIPPALEGCTVLDLGCGTGRDAYIVAQLVGANGRVIGVDMTDEQLSVARRHLDGQMREFGYRTSNVDFRKGYIEDLRGADIADESVDVVISNCVINLSPDKQRVFSEIFRVLKPGGELFFSDIFAGRRVPEPLTADAVLRGECLAGAMYIEDFRRLLRDLGCLDFRRMSSRPVRVDDESLARKIGGIDFHSITVRAFKLESLEDICEDYGQVAVYERPLAESRHAFVLDDHHVFALHKPMPVCGNTAAMLEETRFARHFGVIGNRSRHFGPFHCAAPQSGAGNASSSGSCC